MVIYEIIIIIILVLTCIFVWNMTIRAIRGYMKMKKREKNDVFYKEFGKESGKNAFKRIQKDGKEMMKKFHEAIDYLPCPPRRTINYVMPAYQILPLFHEIEKINKYIDMEVKTKVLLDYLGILILDFENPPEKYDCWMEA